MKKSADVDAYIATFPKDIRARLSRVRRAIHAGPKGNLKFPHADPLPLTLVARIVRHRVKQDRAAAARKKKSAK